MITFTQGDTAVLSLTAQDGNGNPINLTDATFSTQIAGINGVVNTFGNSQHSIVNAALGQFTLSLSSANTAACGLGLHKQILTQITLGSTQITYRGFNILTVYFNQPIQ